MQTHAKPNQPNNIMKTKLLAAITVITAVVALTAPVVRGASDYLLELDGIKGESSDGGHKETIEVLSWSLGASNPTASSGGGAGKVSFSDLSVMMSASQAGPQLLAACATGRPITKAKLYMRKAGETRDYLVIELENVLVTSYSNSGGTSAAGATAPRLPEDGVKLKFTRMTMTHTGDDGTVTTGTAEEVIAPQ